MKIFNFDPQKWNEVSVDLFIYGLLNNILSSSDHTILSFNGVLRNKQKEKKSQNWGIRHDMKLEIPQENLSD
jgi:hypothetical protein